MGLGKLLVSLGMAAVLIMIELGLAFQSERELSMGQGLVLV